MIKYLIIIISLILDGILSNFLPVINLSYFTPLLTLTSIFIVYPFYIKDEYKYYITSFVVGIIYDLLYTNLLFFNGIIFVLIAFVVRIIYKNLNISFLKNILYIILIIIVYESSTALIFMIFKLVPITLSKVVYKITHSLLLNIIYGELIYLILKIIPKKYKKLKIN